MDDASPASERPEEANHEVNRVIGRKDAEITDPGPEGIKRRKGDALLEIVFVGHHAAFGAATCPGGVDDAGEVFALARSEAGRRFFGAEFLPTVSAGEVGGGGSFGEENALQVCEVGAPGPSGQLAPDRIFGD